jgi:hypothetical protein
LKDILQNEEAIVWRDDPDKYPYLREMRIHALFRKKTPKYGQPIDRIIAFSTLKDSAKRRGGLFDRRAWFFRKDDPYPNRWNYPSDGVLPASIKAGVPSQPGRTDLIEEEVALPIT